MTARSQTFADTLSHFALLSGDARQIAIAHELGVRAYMKPHPIQEILSEFAYPTRRANPNVRQSDAIRLSRRGADGRCL